MFRYNESDSDIDCDPRNQDYIHVDDLPKLSTCNAVIKQCEQFIKMIEDAQFFDKEKLVHCLEDCVSIIGSF